MSLNLISPEFVCWTLTAPGMGGSWNFPHLDQSHKKKETGESGLESGWSTRIHVPTKRVCLQTETWKRQDTRLYNTYFAEGIEGMDGIRRAL